jgi:hypothetical protein
MSANDPLPPKRTVRVAKKAAVPRPASARVEAPAIPDRLADRLPNRLPRTAPAPPPDGETRLDRTPRTGLLPPGADPVSTAADAMPARPRSVPHPPPPTIPAVPARPTATEHERVTPRSVLRRILPRTALGITSMILAFSLGASLVGVILYSYYEYRLNQTQQTVTSLRAGIISTANKATSSLKSEEAQAQALIAQQIAPLKSILATGQTLQGIVAKAAPSLYFVHTLDGSGQPAVGTAFAIASDTQQTLLLTSYNVVQAATRKPGPPLYVHHGSSDQQVNVYTWDPTTDLALIILSTGNQAHLSFATVPPQLGERVFALSGLGSQGASITQGFVADVSADGIQHDATTGTEFQGGPLLDSDGNVVGILSRTYSPIGFPVADVWFAIPPSAACQKVLQCPNGNPNGSANSGGGSP